MKPAPLKLEDFAGKVGETFLLRLDSGDKVDIELIEAIGVKGGVPERPSFSILFRIPEDVITHQRTYQVEHGEMGELMLFLVPVGPGETGMQWEAVFT